MKRREFIAGLGGAAAWPLVARADSPGKVWRVGFVSPGFPEAAVFEAFRQRMKDLGYIDGKNLTIEARYAEGLSERLPAFANELVAMPCDVVVAVSTPAIAVVQRATSTIPIVMSPSADPLGSGFIKSLGHPGGNTTGVAALYGEMTDKSIEYLQAVVPNVKKIAVLMSSNPLHPSLYERTQAAARILGLSTVPILAPTPADLDRAFRDIVEAKCDALFVLTDPIRPAIVPLAAANRIPAVYQFSLFVDQGGLASYGANVEAMYSKAAEYVDKIFKGVDPADLPVEQPPKFEFVLNLKTAKSLGLSVPESIILRADRIIE